MMQRRSRRVTAVFILVLLFITACASANGTAQPSSSDQLATMVAATFEALTPSAAPSDSSSDVLPYGFYYLGSDSATGYDQVFWIERDGMTIHQLTYEPANVTSYDVSFIDGSVAYVSNNQLLWADANGAGRRVLVDAGPADVNNPFMSTIKDPVFSADGKVIAYGHKGLSFYSLQTGATSLALENDVDALDGGLYIPRELYSPEKYSPDGSKLLLTLGYYEGASAAIYDPFSGTLVRLSGDEGALICCGDPNWTSDGSFLYAASRTVGRFISGLWRIDASSGVVSTLIDTEASPGNFNIAYAPYLASDGQLYYFFATEASSDGFVARGPLQLVRSAPDGVTGRTVLLSDTFETLNEALWSPDADLVIVALSNEPNDYMGGQAEVVYFDDRPSLVLTRFARDMKWGP